MRIPLRAAALLLALPLICPAGWAQLAPSPDAPPVSTAPPASAEPAMPAPVATFKLQVNLVNLYFTVKDRHGALIPHLTRNNCAIQEDKVPQTIKNFSAETNQPLTLGILLDTSGSQERVLPLEQEAGSAFLNRILEPKDQAFLLSFDTNVDLLQDFTSSPGMLIRALNQARINTGGGSMGIPGAGGNPVPVPGGPRGTLLYDAVYLAATQKLSQQTGRKAMILLTDGQDQGSRTTIQGAVDAAQRANAIIYVILIADRSVYQYDNGYTISSSYWGASAANKLAKETGGRVINVGHNARKLQAAFRQIEEELRTQYLASYTPTNAKQDGTFRRIDVECRDDNGKKLKVQVRKGYFASLPGN